MLSLIKRHKSFVGLLVFIIFWSILLYYIPPNQLVEYFGFSGAYLILFFTALIGVSGLASAPFFAFLTTMAASGQFDPIVLGLIAGPARVLGDIIFYYLGRKGSDLAVEAGAGFLQKFSFWIHRQPKWMVPVIAFFYSGFSPLPQDVLMIPLGLSKISLRIIILPVLLGNTLFIIMFSFFVMTGMSVL